MIFQRNWNMTYSIKYEFGRFLCFSNAIFVLHMYAICPIPKISVSINIHTTFPYIPNIKKAIIGRVALAKGIPKKLL